MRFARFVDTLRAYMRVTIGSASLPKRANNNGVNVRAHQTVLE